MNWYADPDFCLKRVKKSGFNLRFIEKQTEELCITAVKQNPHALAFVKNQTEKVCLEAIKQDGIVLDYIYLQTLEMIEIALQQDLRHIHCIKWDQLSQDEQEYLRLKYELV